LQVQGEGPGRAVRGETCRLVRDRDLGSEFLRLIVGAPPYCALRATCYRSL
jgi:hypothetical protein